MEQVVSITKQGQLTIPKAMRAVFGIEGAVKAVIKKEGERLVVRPKNGFWGLAGALKSKVRLSDIQLAKARSVFAKQWPQV